MAFSPARLNRYKAACGGDTRKAMTLYRYNVKLCQKYYAVLNIFEIILRNAIDRHYRAFFNDPNWIEHQLLPGGILASSPQKAEVLKHIQTLIKKGKLTPDKVVAAHHEPICFDSLGNRNMSYVQTNHQLILDYISFLGYSDFQLLYGYDVQTDELINKIMNL